MRSLFALALVLVATSATAACGGSGGGDDGGGDDGDADADPGGDEPRFDEPANLISVAELAWPGIVDAQGMISAQLATGTTGLLTEVMRDGNCRLLTSDAEYCTSCTGFCVDDVCHDWPTYRDAGRITISGTTTEATLTFSSGYYAVSPFPLPDDLFAPGDAVTATAQGADVPAFTAEATGVATLEPELQGACANEVTFTRGQDNEITWAQPVAGARVRLRIPSVNRGHGLPPQGLIECEGADTGRMRIGSALLAAMPDFVEIDGCSGIACAGVDCPPAAIARYTRGTATAGSEPVTLRVESTVTFVIKD